MAIGKNPELYISDPVYETTLEVPELNSVDFVYVGYNPNEMQSDQPRASFTDLSNPVYRYSNLRWHFNRRQNQTLQGTEVVITENMGSMTMDEAEKVVDASKFFFNRSLQLILEDTIPEVRLDPRRFTVASPPADTTDLQAQFVSAVQARLDTNLDDPDNVEIYQVYLESLKQVLGPDKVANTFDEVIGYLRDTTQFLNEVQSAPEIQTFESPRSALKFKVSMSNKFAPSLIASAIATQGPYSLELNQVIGEARNRKSSFDSGGNAVAFNLDASATRTKEEIYDSFTKMNPTIDNLIRMISMLFTGQVIDPDGASSTEGDDAIKSAYRELFMTSDRTINLASPQTKQVLNSVANKLGSDLFVTMGSLVSDLVQPVGFKVWKTELRPVNGQVDIVEHKPFYVLDSRISHVTDTKIRYGSVYNYSISAVYKMTIPFIGVAGELLKKTVYVASEPSNLIRMIAEDFSPVNVVPDVEIFAVKNADLEPNGIRLMWNHPADIKEKIRSFRVYRRSSNLREPFQLLREFQFRKPPITHEVFFAHEIASARALAPNGPLVDLTQTIDKPVIPTRYLSDTSFLNTEQYIYMVTAIDMHGNESACSDQVTLSLDDSAQGTQKLISIRGAPIEYPNLYIDRRAIIDSKIANSIQRSRTKAVIFFDPVASRIHGLDYRGQGLKTGDQSSITPSLAESYLKNNLTTFDASVQLRAGRNESGQQDGSDAFIFTADGSILFDGISAEYDFIVFDETTLKTAVIRTNVKYGDDSDVGANFW